MKRESPRDEPGASKSLAGDSSKRNPQRRHSPATSALDWAITRARVKPISDDRSKRIGVATTRLVLIGFARYVNADDQAFPSAATLAEDLGLDRVQVTYALAELESAHQGILIRVSGKAGGKVTRRLNRQPVGEITTGRQAEPVGEIPTGERPDLSSDLWSDLWSDLSGESRQEVEVEDLGTDTQSPHLTERTREADGADLAVSVLAEAGLPAAHRARLLDISASTSTYGTPTDFPAGRLSDPKHRAASLRILRVELEAVAPRCPRCGRSIDICEAQNAKLAPEDRCAP